MREHLIHLAKSGFGLARRESTGRASDRRPRNLRCGWRRENDERKHHHLSAQIVKQRLLITSREKKADDDDDCEVFGDVREHTQL